MEWKNNGKGGGTHRRQRLIGAPVKGREGRQARRRKGGDGVEGPMGGEGSIGGVNAQIAIAHHFGQQWAKISWPTQSMLSGQNASAHVLPSNTTGQLFCVSISEWTCLPLAHFGR